MLSKVHWCYSFPYNIVFDFIFVAYLNIYNDLFLITHLFILQNNSSIPPCPWGAPAASSPAWGSPLVSLPQPIKSESNSPRFSPYNSKNTSSPMGQYKSQGYRSPGHMQSQRYSSSPRSSGPPRGRQHFTPQRNNFQSSPVSSNSPTSHRSQDSNHISSPHRQQLQNHLAFNSNQSPNQRFQSGSNRGFRSPGHQGTSPGHRGRGGNRQVSIFFMVY